MIPNRRHMPARGHMVRSGLVIPQNFLVRRAVEYSMRSGAAAIGLGAASVAAAGQVRVTGASSQTLGATSVSTGLGVVGVPTDGPGAWFVPSQDSHWTSLATLNSKISIPTRYYGCQDVAAGLAEVNGGLILLQNNTTTYGNSVTGWTRKFAGTGGTGSDGWYHNTALGSNPSSTSVAWLIYLAFTTPAATRVLVTLSKGPTAETHLRTDSAGALSLRNDSAQVALSPATSHGGLTVVHPILVVQDNTAQQLRCYTDIATAVHSTWVTPADWPKGPYPTGAQAAVSRLGYVAQWAGAAAEALDKTVIETMTHAAVPY